MDITRITRSLVALVGLFFATLGLAVWIAPASTAHALGLAAIDAGGGMALRADLGGLFVGLALLCGAGAWTRRRAWLLAAATMLVAIIGGRTIAALVGGDGPIGAGELGIELVALAILGASARAWRSEARPLARRSLRIAGAATGALVGSVAVLLQLHAVQQWIFDRAAAKLTQTQNTAPLADDALRVAVCGSSAPLPSAKRAKSCVAVFAGGKIWIVDVGPESVENLMLWNVPLANMGGVLLTHFHSDHIGDLGELQLQTWAGGRKSPLAVYGGPGVERVVAGFNEAYGLDQGYRTAHHGEDVMPSAAWPMVAHPVELDGPPTDAMDRSALVLDDGDLRITAIEVDHSPIKPAYAYRFDYRGRSVVVTGDLKYRPSLANAARGADLLVSEAIATDMTKSLGSAAAHAGRDSTAAIMHDIEDYHITPEQAAQVANDAGVDLLVFYHLLPAPDGWLTRQLFAHGVDAARDGEWTIADDGSLYTLPLDSDDILRGTIAR
ncbi:MAG TPA: MBL fold metallo-hydrolase [Nannocystaceae bacterium]|nr:MBL fold metallo-hydrolase [Nannocystaceae bacterium]